MRATKRRSRGLSRHRNTTTDRLYPFIGISRVNMSDPLQLARLGFGRQNGAAAPLARRARASADAAPYRAVSPLPSLLGKSRQAVQLR